jgi:hypothetical protein
VSSKLGDVVTGENKVVPSVRLCKKMDWEGMQFTSRELSPNRIKFDPAQPRFLQVIRKKVQSRLLAGSGSVQLRPQKLNVYRNKGHFKPHIDHLVPNLLATIVIVLPI